MSASIATNRPLRRHRLVAWCAVGVIVIGLLATYAFFAFVNQPLTAGSDQGIYPPQAETALDTLAGPVRLLPYVDGETLTLVQSLANTGPVDLSVTGVALSSQLSPAHAAFSVTEARAAIPAGLPCCGDIDVAATWAAPRFNPMQLQPGQQVAIALHLVINQCNTTRVAVFQTLDSISVQYTVLGVSHTQDVQMDEAVGVKMPDTCPG